ncbi:rCG55864 [Rattus norvegicus]|uniref:RCG55864 n=1 Tax=Rattus norvegicus TaxID=10116 RepID=A6JM06_RAT|nr:rCG55864 [Rattus norvegicus]
MQAAGESTVRAEPFVPKAARRAVRQLSRPGRPDTHDLGKNMKRIAPTADDFETHTGCLRSTCTSSALTKMLPLIVQIPGTENCEPHKGRGEGPLPFS